MTSWTSFKNLRELLMEEGTIVRNPKEPETELAAEDIPVSSSSAAAAVVVGRNTNGREARTVEGTVRPTSRGLRSDCQAEHPNLA